VWITKAELAPRQMKNRVVFGKLAEHAGDESAEGIGS